MNYLAKRNTVPVKGVSWEDESERVQVRMERAAPDMNGSS